MIQRIREKMREEGIDCLILTDERNLEWAFGKELVGYGFINQDEVHLIVPRAHQYDLTEYPADFAFSREEYEQLLKKRSEKASGTVRADQSSEKIEEIFSAETTDIVEDLRMIKTEEEIQNFRKACEITDKAFENLRPGLFSGLDEFEAAAKLKEVYTDEGVLESFLTSEYQSLVQANCMLPHRGPRKREIRSDDLVIADTGARYERCCADVTRTYCENPSEEQRELFYTVKEIQEELLKDVEPGVRIQDLVEKRDRLVGEKGYSPEEHILYTLGHGVGVQTHEAPKLSNSSEGELKENMVLAIEPGLHVPEVGGVRIEDVVLVTEDGCEVLSKVPKEL